MREIMIVDDDKNVVNGLLNHISWDQLNMKVIASASNGEEALMKIRKHQPALLITDIYMPKVNGIELIRQINKEFPEIYIMIHSGYNHFDNAREAIKFGVKHFFLKPSTVEEIESVLADIDQEMIVEEKRQEILANYNEQLKDYLSYTRDALIRDMLASKYTFSKIPTEKLELVHLKKDTAISVASLNLIRPPYITRSKERDWQLLKLSSSNIIKEIVKEEDVLLKQVDIHLVDYSDSSFVLLFMAKQASIQLNELCYIVTKKIIENILIYLKLSSNVGIGRVKEGLLEVNDAYLESQKALEAAEYQEMNRVFTYEEEHKKGDSKPFQYPFEILKEVQNAIQAKEYKHLLNIWGKFEQQSIKENTPLYIVQNICFSIMNSFMLDYYSDEQLKENNFKMTENVTNIYVQHSSKDLIQWMQNKLIEWSCHRAEELVGKKSNKLIRGVRDYVQNYYDQEITLAEIADSLYVNRNYLSQLFKRITGETFVSYLNKFRIEKAKEKLKEQHYMVYEVSEMVGYQNPTYFSQVFKSLTGVSPSEFYKE